MLPSNCLSLNFNGGREYSSLFSTELGTVPGSFRTRIFSEKFFNTQVSGWKEETTIAGIVNDGGDLMNVGAVDMNYYSVT